MKGPPEPPPGPSSLADQVRLQLQDVRVLPGLFAGAMSGIIVIIFSISLAALIFRGDLAGHLPAGIGIALASAAIIGIVSTLGSSFRPIIAAPQENTAVIISLMAASISAYMKGADPTADPFPTIVIAIALTAVVAGAFFLALGMLRLGKVVRFIPYPVVGGFLAGTGWLLFQGSFSVMAGNSLTPAEIPLLFQPGVFMSWVPGFGFGVVLTVVLRRYHHFLLLPALLVASIVIFYALLLGTGTPIAVASQKGLLLGSIPSGGLWPPLTLGAIAEVNWAVIPRQLGNVFAITILASISILLNASGLELATEKEIDLDRELRTTGVANLATGLLGGMVGYLSLSESTLNHRAGANSRLAGITSALLCVLALVVGAQTLSYFPKPVLGGLLLFLGLAFLVESVYDAYFRLPRVEYGLVLLILIAVAWIGFLEGVAVGIVVSSILFAVNYSRINVVKHAISGVDLRSNVDRRAIDERILEKKGGHIHILQLQGYIFFGTAYNLLKEVVRRILSKTPLPVRYVVLDFRHVDGLDSSAVVSFARMKKLAESQLVMLCLAELPPNIMKQLVRGGCIDPESKPNRASRAFPDLDHALEWCESQLLITNTMVRPKPTSLARELEQSFPDAATVPLLMSYLERVEAAAGYELFRQGEMSDDMYLIESGEATAWLELEGGARRRLRTMGSGTVVGESGMYLRAKRSATVMTNGPSILYRLSNESLARMTADAPHVAAAFHQFVARLLAERMVHATKAVQKIFY
jgi:SulP family sulfate permease